MSLGIEEPNNISRATANDMMIPVKLAKEMKGRNGSSVKNVR